LVKLSDMQCFRG